MNRREALRSIAAGGATGALVGAAALAVPATAEVATDAMALAVADYERALAVQASLVATGRYEAVQSTFYDDELMPRRRRIVEDPPSVATLEGVAAAIRYVTIDEDFVDDDHARVLLKALAFLEGAS